MRVTKGGCTFRSLCLESTGGHFQANLFVGIPEGYALRCKRIHFLYAKGG